MAPKVRKSTLAWNPLQGFRSSSSFDPLVPLHIQFHDKKARNDFLESFWKRGIHLKHQVILLDFADTPLPAVMRTGG